LLIYREPDPTDPNLKDRLMEKMNALRAAFGGEHDVADDDDEDWGDD
jgi:hypothetical protein